MRKKIFLQKLFKRKQFSICILFYKCNDNVKGSQMLWMQISAIVKQFAFYWSANNGQQFNALNFKIRWQIKRPKFTFLVSISHSIVITGVSEQIKYVKTNLCQWHVRTAYDYASSKICKEIKWIVNVLMRVIQYFKNA